ncbi:MAG: HAD family hydrolase [Chloroflexota bacterium]|nr:HAD family hydrolase [Chloroflexota bacterium]
MKPELLIFHLNGAVIDVSHSVDTAVRRTVQSYLAYFLGISGSGALVSEEDVEWFRVVAGLENPWELATGMLRYVLSLLPKPLRKGSPPTNPGEAVAVLKKRRGPVEDLSLADVREKADFAAAAERIRDAGGGLEGVAEMVGGWEHPLLMAEGEVQEGNLVRHLFQEIYLGRQTFGRLERMHARFYRGAGMIENERLLLGPGTLERIRAHYRRRMAAVTEWTREMAQLSMNHLKIGSVFDALITWEDLVAEEARLQRLGEERQLRKPHPFVLLDAAAHLDPNGTRPAVYIGNTPDDMRAARAAAETDERPFLAWAILTASSNPQRLKARLEEAGAERIFDQPSELMDALLA